MTVASPTEPAPFLPPAPVPLTAKIRCRMPMFEMWTDYELACNGLVAIETDYLWATEAHWRRLSRSPFTTWRLLRHLGPYIVAKRLRVTVAG